MLVDQVLILNQLGVKIILIFLDNNLTKVQIRQNYNIVPNL